MSRPELALGAAAGQAEYSTESASHATCIGVPRYCHGTWRSFLLVGIALFTLAGCHSMIGRYDRPAIAANMDTFPGNVQSLSDRASTDPTLALRLPARSELTLVDSPVACLDAPLLLRAAWVSDVQIRPPDVKLGSRRLSKVLDGVVSSFEHNSVQESLGWAVYLSQIRLQPLGCRPRRREPG